MASPRGTLDQQLTRLDHRLLRMGSLVDEAIELALRALVERDSSLAIRVIGNDQTINELRYIIEEQSYSMLARQNPLAGDLRRIMAAVSLATNMERMGDHAAGICVLARRLNREPQLKPLIDLPRMAAIARTMLRRSLDAFLAADAELARAVAAEDQEINRLNEQLLRELLSYMLEDPTTIRRATYLLWVAHNLERIGDRCKNIGERVVYIATGKLEDFDPHAVSPEELDRQDVLSALSIGSLDMVN